MSHDSFLFQADRLAEGLSKILESCEAANPDGFAIAALCDRAVEIIVSSKVSRAARHMRPSSGAAQAAALDAEWVRTLPLTWEHVIRDLANFAVGSTISG